MVKAAEKSTDEFMDRFAIVMQSVFSCAYVEHAIAVAVSGGPDSIALCYALAECLPQEIEIHALTVDHGLRAESAKEATDVGKRLDGLDRVQHHTLTWKHEEPMQSRIQEEARMVRYALMREYMQERGIKNLFLGHHMDDQAETFLFRLAKGSGLDGLSGISAVQEMDKDFRLCRPFLGFYKEDLTGFCEERGLTYIQDPSNDSEAFARVRLRKSMNVLEEEGLSAKRLSVTASRLRRAQDALDFTARKSFDNNVLILNNSRIVFKFELLVSEPEEVVLRVLLRAMSVLNPSDGYGVRLERLEQLCADMMKPDHFRKRTLGGVIFERKDADGEVVLSTEKR